VQYCHDCGSKLSLGTEKYCPECGQNLIQGKDKGKVNKINISDTKGNTIGTGIEGTGHFVGKEIGYTVNGNVINLHISGSGNISNELIDSLQKITNASTPIDPKSLIKNTECDKDIKEKLDETNKNRKQITSILQEVDNIEKKERIQPIEVIKAENIEISKQELLFKEYTLKGEECYYKKEYNEAIQCYDKALEIEPNHAYVWIKKASALVDLGKLNEVIQCIDKALEIEPNDAPTWNNKGLVLAKLGKYDEAIQCYDRALEIDPYNDQIKQNRNIALEKLGKSEKKLG
jgi:tetratricopeptide (TPR) repeat protein